MLKLQNILQMCLYTRPLCKQNSKKEDIIRERKKIERIIKLEAKEFRRLVGVNKETYREKLKVVKRG
jgi:hypothetical protein